MITGYNTDVRHGDVVFHVQTEDKGTSNPFIESLIYVGGQVLATKRASYAELLAQGHDEKEIVAFMDHQHRTMIAAIRHGKFDSRLAAISSRPTRTSAVPILAPVRGTGMMPTLSPAAAGPLAPPQAATAAAFAPATSVTPASPANPASPPTPGIMATPAAPAASRPQSATERTLDQVILEYLTNEADQEQLVLVLEGEADLGLGRRASLALRTSSSKSGLPVAGAQVSVRMISTIAEPRVLAAGRTDEHGGLPLRFEIPPLDRGTAALIISAISTIGRAELKHLL